VLRIGLAALAVTALMAGPAAAAERYVTMKGAPGAGPAKYDRVWVQKLGPARARRVLVLVPGALGGAGVITPVARHIVRRVPGLAIWIVDRRQQAFEDTPVFERRDRRAALDYYAGLRYRSVKGEDARFVSDWGLRLQLEDLRRVVRRAAAGGRQVILGGHSAGASTAVAYAAWDFAGKPGHRELNGLVLIDGGLLGSFDEASAKRARRELAEIRAGSVFLDVLGFDIPEIAGIFTQLGALYAQQRPNQRSALQRLPLIPEALKPPFPVTNEAQLGYVFDETTSPDDFATFQVSSGRLARSGEPRPWRDGELTPIRRLARAYAGNRPNALEWYYPRRLLLDIDAANDLRMNAAARFLGLRLMHGREIDLPLYAYSTVLTRGRVARGARRLARMSCIDEPSVVDDRAASHLDPLLGAPARNDFLRTVVPFLRRLAD
jgi:pimeloyl-ACP methyl ester carboxylesterase